MKRPRISLVVACAQNGVIGRDNALPWHLPDDLKRFKEITLGKPIVMGRKTYESIGRPLPGRENRVISRQTHLHLEGCRVFSDLASALKGGEDEIMVIGGEQIFAAALPFAERLYVTEVQAEIEGDARFPPFDPSNWLEIEQLVHPADSRHAYPFIFKVLQREDASVSGGFEQPPR